jgi:chaperonin GroEL (HSP60 family)
VQQGQQLKKELFPVVVSPISGQLNLLQKLKGENEDQNTGIAIVRRAIEEPLRIIVENAGMEGSIVIQRVKEGKGRFWLQCIYR